MPYYQYADVTQPYISSTSYSHEVELTYVQNNGDYTEVESIPERWVQDSAPTGWQKNANSWWGHYHFQNIHEPIKQNNLADTHAFLISRLDYCNVLYLPQDFPEKPAGLGFRLPSADCINRWFIVIHMVLSFQATFECFLIANILADILNLCSGSM